MLVIGIILILVAAVVFGYLWFGTQGLPALDLDLGIFQVSLSPLLIYLLGAATLLVLVLGLAALGAGIRRQSRRRREVKQLRQQVQQRPESETQRDTGRSPGPGRERTQELPRSRSGTDRPYEREVPTGRTTAGEPGRSTRPDTSGTAERRGPDGPPRH